MNKKLSFTVFTPANMVTYCGMLLVIISYYLLLNNNILAGVIVYIIAAMTDWLDGFVAKNKTIQKFFNGRGVSQLGKALDPIRDVMLRVIIFIMAYINDISLALPIITGLITLTTFLLFNRRINRLRKEVSVIEVGRSLQFTDCSLVILWLIIIIVNPALAVDSGVLVLWLILITNILRFFAYKKEYNILTDEMEEYY